MMLGARLARLVVAVGVFAVAAPVFAQAASDPPSVSGSLASSKAITPPELVKSTEPEYPASAKAERREPTVVLSLSIDEQGAVTSVEVVESGGADFDAALTVV